MVLVGRTAVIAELDTVLAGAGELVSIVGPSGSGKTALLSAVAATARARGFEVLAAAPVPGQLGRSVWAQLLAQAGGSDDLVSSLLGADPPLAVSAAVRLLTEGPLRLVAIDDIDVGGSDAVAVLGLLAARLVGTPTAVVVTSGVALGLGREVTLGGLSEPELAELVADLPEDRRHAVWVVSRGLPGPAGRLAQQLRELPAGHDPLVHLALQAQPVSEFLLVDDELVQLLETALERSEVPDSRAALLARLARVLLGDPLSGPRRRVLADEALMLARAGTDVATLIDVLDARLHALWDPQGAQDRLAAAAEIIALARDSGDSSRTRDGLFWRFIALMELARVPEAEQTLVSFERQAAAAGDAEAAVIALSRHAMLAALRGRFATALQLADEMAERAQRIGLPDADRLHGAVRGMVFAEVGDEAEGERALAVLYAIARRLPGHFYEATAARILAGLGRTAEATAELQRLLPGVLVASGPRWIGVVADLAETAVQVGDRVAARRLYDVLLPYRGRLVVWGGSNATSGTVSHHLGRLATRLDMPSEAVSHLEDAVDLAERIGALPSLAHSLSALGDALLLRADGPDHDRASGAHARGAELASALGMSRLLAATGPSHDEWTLRRDGDSWVLSAGPEHARLPDGRGMAQLCALLAAPGREVSALDLSAGGAGLQAVVAEPVLDAAAVATYRRRLEELAAELDAADVAGDDARAVRAQTERQALIDELRRSSGLGGRIRKATGEAERARINVTRTLRAALERISAVAPRAGAHLEATIRTGLACRYDPHVDPLNRGPQRWRV